MLCVLCGKYTRKFNRIYVDDIDFLYTLFVNCHGKHRHYFHFLNLTTESDTCTNEIEYIYKSGHHAHIP